MFTPQLFRKLALGLALLTIAPLASLAAGLGTLYDHGKPYAEILAIDGALGGGNVGTVMKVLIQVPGGKPKWKALKFFTPDSEHSQKAQEEIAKNWSRLSRVPMSQRAGVITNAKRLDLPHSESPLIPKGPVTIEELASGSMGTQKVFQSLALDPHAPNLGARLSIVAKYQEQVLKGIRILASHHLVHADINPKNVHYTADPTFRWDHPDPKKIEFQLSDFDLLSESGAPYLGSTFEYSPPEMITEHVMEHFSSQDVYAHAVSVYELAFGSEPWAQYLKEDKEASKRLRQLKFPDRSALEYYFAHELKLGPEQRFLTLNLHILASHPDEYEKYLHWVDQKIKNRIDQMPTRDARKTLEELREFIVSGLSYHPVVRIQNLEGVSCIIPSLEEFLRP